MSCSTPPASPRPAPTAPYHARTMAHRPARDESGAWPRPRPLPVLPRAPSRFSAIDPGVVFSPSSPPRLPDLVRATADGDDEPSDACAGGQPRASPPLPDDDEDIADFDFDAEDDDGGGNKTVDCVFDNEDDESLSRKQLLVRVKVLRLTLDRTLLEKEELEERKDKILQENQKLAIRLSKLQQRLQDLRSKPI